MHLCGVQMAVAFKTKFETELRQFSVSPMLSIMHNALCNKLTLSCLESTNKSDKGRICIDMIIMLVLKFICHHHASRAIVDTLPLYRLRIGENIIYTINSLVWGIYIRSMCAFFTTWWTQYIPNGIPEISKQINNSKSIYYIMFMDISDIYVCNVLNRLRYPHSFTFMGCYRPRTKVWNWGIDLLS